MSIGGAAALAIAPIVMALTGLCRGIGKASVPLPMMVCLPSRTTRQPAFSKARMASLCRMPGILGMDRNVYLGGLDDFALAAPLLGLEFGFDLEHFADGDGDVLHGLGAGGALGPATGKHRATSGVAFVTFDQDDRVFHARKVAARAWMVK